LTPLSLIALSLITLSLIALSFFGSIFTLSSDKYCVLDILFDGDLLPSINFVASIEECKFELFISRMGGLPAYIGFGSAGCIGYACKGCMDCTGCKGCTGYTGLKG